MNTLLGILLLAVVALILFGGRSRAADPVEPKAPPLKTIGREEGMRIAAEAVAKAAAVNECLAAADWTIFKARASDNPTAMVREAFLCFDERNAHDGLPTLTLKLRVSERHGEQQFVTRESKPLPIDHAAARGEEICEVIRLVNPSIRLWMQAN